MIYKHVCGLPIGPATLLNFKMKPRVKPESIILIYNTHTFGARINIDFRVSSLRKADVSENPVAT